MALTAPPAVAPGRLAVDSVTIVGTYVLTAATGLLFWVAAARLIPAGELGVQTALISLVTTVGTVTSYGVASAYKAILPAATASRRARLIDGALITIVVAAAVGVACAAAASDALGGGTVVQALIPVGSVLMALFVLKDAALIGLGWARWLPVSNVVAALAKVALVVVLVGEVGLPAAWATLIPAGVVGLAVFGVLLARVTDAPQVPAIADARLSRRAMAVFAVRDGIASSTSFGVILVLPFLTTWLAGPVAGATLAVALAVAAALDFVPDGMGAALTAHLAKDPSGVEAAVRRMLRTATAVVVPVAVTVAAGSSLIGAVFGPQYTGHTFCVTLAVLAAGSVARIPYAMWMAVLRATHRTRTIMVVNAAIFAVYLPVTVGLTRTHGSIGAAAGMAVGSALLGAVSLADLRRRRLVTSP